MFFYWKEKREVEIRYLLNRLSNSLFKRMYHSTISLITQNKSGNMADNTISILFSFGPLSWPLNEDREQNRSTASKQKGDKTAKVACNLIFSDDLFTPNPGLTWSLWQSIPLTAMQAGFGLGKVSACIPSCSVQLLQRNAGPARALAWDGVRTSSAKKNLPLSAWI